MIIDLKDPEKNEALRNKLLQIKTKRALKGSLYQFLQHYWPIATGERYIDNWHVKELCEIIQEHLTRVINRQHSLYDWIIINVPPGASKSTIGSIMAHPWAWTNDPSIRFITGSHDAKLATRLSINSRDVIQCQDYRDMFGDTFTLKIDSNNKTAYDNTKRGSRMICSVGGGITGNHAHVIILDDPIDPEGAKSEAEKQSAIDWVDKTIPSRVLNDDIALKIMIMQRLGENDPTGHLLKKGNDILHICLPAEITDLNNVEPKEFEKFYINGLFDPKRKSRKVLKKRKVDLGSAEYATQYLQSPKSSEGNIFKRDYWKYYKEIPNLKPIRIVQSWDTAFKDKQQNDFSCGTTWHQFPHGYYLTDFWMKQVKSPQLIEQIKIWDSKWHPHKILIEDKASGIVALQILEDQSSLPIEGINPLKDKIARAESAIPTIEAGNVYLPEYADYTSDLVDRLSMFPNGNHDDDADSITQFLNWVREQSKGFSIGFTKKINHNLKGY